ncbi:MAG: ATP-binding protein [Candidatus Aminicenantes bacterium]|nr:MAG: ATP-binding protein [Candidatus Aminicenantes bacterium]
MEELAKSGGLEYFTPEWMTPFLYLNQPVHRLIDFSKETTDTAYFFKKPSFRPVEGGKYVGYGFIGRRKEIIRLTNLFKKENHCICIYGQGGIGKTTLAIRFADNFDNGSYNIIQFRGEVTEEKILTGLATEAKEKLGDKIVKIINSPDFSPEIKLNMLIEQYLSREKVIVLFDNFEDNQLESKEKKIFKREIHSKTLKAFLAHFCNNLKSSSYILFTTRYRFPEPMIEGFNLGEMSFPDSFKLINRFERLILLETGDKREIHEKLGGHPRALELLEGYFKKEKITWDDVAAGFKEVEEKEINHDLLLDMLWNRLNHTERRVLKAASVFRGMTVFEGLEKVTGMKASNIKNVLESLNAFSLVYLEEDTFNFHRLTSTFVTTSKMEKSERKKTHILAAEYLYEIQNEEKVIYLEDLLEARWHFLQAEEWDRAAELTCAMIDKLIMTGYHQLAFKLLNEISERNIREKNRAEVYHLHGILYAHFGDYNQALKQYEKAIHTFKKIGDIKGASASLGQAGILYQNKGDYELALEQYGKGIKISEKIGDVKSISASLHQIGNVYFLKGEYNESLKQYKKSMEIREKIGDIKGVAENLHQIGNIHFKKGEYNQAIKQYEKSMRLTEKIMDIKGVAESFGQLGILYFETKDYTKALQFSIKSFLIFAKLGSPKINIVKKCILSLKRAMPGEQFNEILNEFNLPPEVFDEAEKEQEKSFYEFIFNITSYAVDAKEKNTNEKEPVIKLINEILEQIPGNAPGQEGIRAYFQMLLAYLADEDYSEYKEKIPPDLYGMFETLQEKLRGSKVIDTNDE